MRRVDVKMRVVYPDHYISSKRPVRYWLTVEYPAVSVASPAISDRNPGVEGGTVAGSFRAPGNGVGRLSRHSA